MQVEGDAGEEDAARCSQQAERGGNHDERAKPGNLARGAEDNIRGDGKEEP
jgi:hypothetical protein